MPESSRRGNDRRLAAFRHPLLLYAVVSEKGLNRMFAIRTFLATAMLALTAAGAHAQAVPPKPDPVPTFRSIDMTMVLKDLTGKAFKDPTEPAGKDQPDLTAGMAIALSLCGERPEDNKETALSKARRCNLGQSLLNNKQASLTGPQIKEIEDRITNWAPAVALRIVALIDPAQSLNTE
jgi:hypothetical protein